MKELVECLDSYILYSEGVKKALEVSNSKKRIKDKYNTGYYDAVKDELEKLNMLRAILADEIDKLNQENQNKAA